MFEYEILENNYLGKIEKPENFCYIGEINKNFRKMEKEFYMIKIILLNMKVLLNLMKLMEMEIFIILTLNYFLRVNLKMAIFIMESIILKKVLFFMMEILKIINQMEKEYFMMKMDLIALEVLRKER